MRASLNIDSIGTRYDSAIVAKQSFLSAVSKSFADSNKKNQAVTTSGDSLFFVWRDIELSATARLVLLPDHSFAVEFRFVAPKVDDEKVAREVFRFYAGYGENLVSKVGADFDGRDEMFQANNLYVAGLLYAEVFRALIESPLLLPQPAVSE